MGRIKPRKTTYVDCSAPCCPRSLQSSASDSKHDSGACKVQPIARCAGKFSFARSSFKMALELVHDFNWSKKSAIKLFELEARRCLLQLAREEK